MGSKSGPKMELLLRGKNDGFPLVLQQKWRNPRPRTESASLWRVEQVSFTSACSVMRSAWFVYIRNARHMNACMICVFFAYSSCSRHDLRTLLLQTLFARHFRRLSWRTLFACHYHTLCSLADFTCFFPTLFSLAVLTYHFPHYVRTLCVFFIFWEFWAIVDYTFSQNPPNEPSSNR